MLNFNRLDSFNDFDSIRAYHPYRRGTNPNFDNWSSDILKLKRNREDAIYFFKNQVIKYLQLKLYTFSVITYVPSHDANQTTPSGIALVAKMVASDHNKQFLSCLKRIETISKLSQGGCRHVNVHLNSLTVVEQHLIKKQSILLLDDVTTTGNSFKACKILFKKAGALDVYCLALGKTQ
jgi:predicted amidophosphoribosyltransferase